MGQFPAPIHSTECARRRINTDACKPGALCLSGERSRLGFFFVFSFIFRVVAFLSLTQLLGCQPKSDKKPGPQRFIHFSLHCWNAAKAKGSIRLLLQARRQWGKAAQHDPVLCVKPSTCLQKLMQWSCLLFISGIKCPGHAKMLWMRVLLGLVCILVSQCSLASRQPSTCKLV